MKITTKGRYALRSLLAICEAGDSGPISIRKISERENISPEFLEQIFSKLRKAGIVYAVRGPGGGFALAKAPSEISLKALLEASGEQFETAPCLGCNPCKGAATCVARTVWAGFQDTMMGYLEAHTLDELLGARAG